MWNIFKIYLCTTLVFTLYFTSGVAQDADLSEIDTEINTVLKPIAKQMFTGKNDTVRQAALHQFIPKFVGALKQEGSFYQKFDSIQGLSCLYPADSSWRIFSWQFNYDNLSTRHFGAIQMETQYGLELFPLFDWSDTMTYHTDYLLSPKTWFGAVYYNLMEQVIDGKPYYLLFGFDGADAWTDRKIIEVLHFENNKPYFGAPIFDVPEFAGVDMGEKRFWLEYREGSPVGLRYDSTQQVITFDHVAPYDAKMKGMYFGYIPDGTYEGLKYNPERGKFVWVDKIFHYSINATDNPPRPVPILNNTPRGTGLFPPKP